MYIQDDFSQDQALLSRLADEAAWAAMPRLSWWEGWWVRPPRNLWEETVAMIWQRQPGLERQIAGFEYWANVLGAEGTCYQGWHKDKDEKVYKETGEVVCPTTGTIFYCFPHDIDGGYLEIAKGEDLTDVERIEPVYNRLIIFDASRWHRVSRVYRGVRRAFLVNLWTHKPKKFEEA